MFSWSDPPHAAGAGKSELAYNAMQYFSCRVAAASGQPEPLFASAGIPQILVMNDSASNHHISNFKQMVNALRAAFQEPSQLSDGHVSENSVRAKVTVFTPSPKRDAATLNAQIALYRQTSVLVSEWVSRCLVA